MAPWTDVAGWTLLHFVWQGTAIGIVAAAGLRLLRASTPPVRYALASAAMIAMLIAPVATALRLSSSAPLVARSPHVTSVPSPALTLASDPTRREEAATPSVRQTVLRP